MRLLKSIVLLFLISIGLFVAFRLMPGDPTALFLHGGADADTVAFYREKWRLDDPIYIQYAAWLNNLLHLDAGESLHYGVPVFEFIRSRVFNSIILIAPAVTTGFLLGCLNGSILGTTKRKYLERTGTGFVIFLTTLPPFYLGILAIIIFAGFLGVLPSSGMIPPDVYLKYSEAPWWRPYVTIDFLVHFILPYAVISLRASATPTLVMLTSIQEVRGQGFVSYQRVLGLPKKYRLAHLGRHASLPVITIYPIAMTKAISGMVLVEVVFAWPGIGKALVDAVLTRDFPIMQVVFLVIAAFIIFGNFVIDILYGVIDPRVSVSDEGEG